MTDAPIRRRILVGSVLVALGASCWTPWAAPAQADPFTSQKELLRPPAKLMDDPPLPVLSDAEKTYLIKLARRALEHSAREGKAYEPTDVPASLRMKDYIAYVTARQAGRLIDGIAGEGTGICENLARAALHVSKHPDFGEDRLAGIRDSVIDVNVLGPGQALLWNNMDNVAKAISPGVHGLAVRTGGNTRAIRDTVAPTRGYDSTALVSGLLEVAGLRLSDILMHKDQVIFYRFRSVHLLEWPNERGYVELFRCAQLIPVGQIDNRRLSDLIDLIGRYMLYRQLRTGLFSYEYSPATGRYSQDDNAARQAGSTWALAAMARETGLPDYEQAAARAIAAAPLRVLDGTGAAACASYPSEKDREGLGSTALLLLAAVDLPDNASLAAKRDQLAAALIRQQRADGSFKVYFDERPDDGNRFYFPGEALLALARTYERTADKKYLAAVEKAFDCYHQMFQTGPDRSFAAWHCQAWQQAFESTGTKKYAEFVLQMGDYLVGFQAGEKAEVYPDMVGGFVSDEGVAGIGTAAFLEGVASAYRVARAVGDKVRLDRYGQCLRLGARFLDQLTFKEAEAFYCVSKKDVIGGVKQSPLLHTVRIDNCQHALLALIAIRREMFPPSLPIPARRP